VSVKREDHHATRTGEDRKEMIGHDSTVPSGSVAASWGSLLRISVCARKTSRSVRYTEEKPETGKQSAFGRHADRWKGERIEMTGCNNSSMAANDGHGCH
jgi:hypothetical protein